MKIIHTSDIHLDSPLTSRLTPEMAKGRRRELLAGFSRLINDAKGLSVDAVIIAGDLFDNEKVSKRALDTAIDVITSAPEIKFFYLPGNHEKGALLSGEREIPKNLFIFGEEWTYFKAHDVVIAGRSRCSEGMLESLDLREENKNIVVLHGELRDRCASPDIVGLKDMAERNIDYLALGHYHSYRSYKIPGGGSAVYCGTPEGRGFDEDGECGYVLIDTRNEIDYRFVPFAKRRIHVVKTDVGGLSTLGEVKEAISSSLIGIKREDIVRLELVGQKQLDLWLDEDALAERFKNAFYYFEIKNSTRLLIKKEDHLYDKSLRGEFIRLVEARDDLDEITKEKIIETGLYALMGEEV